jgi:hypothetical protein
LNPAPATRAISRTRSATGRLRDAPRVDGMMQ